MAEIRRHVCKSHHTKGCDLVSKTYLTFLDTMLGSTEQIYYKMYLLLLIQLTCFLVGFAKHVSALTPVRTEHPDMTKNKFLM